MLRGKPLRSRPLWLMGPLAYVAILILGLIALLTFVQGVWLAVGLTVLAFPAGMVPELLTDLRYGKYRQEWELANEAEANTSN
jgi:hypothetical protein